MFRSRFVRRLTAGLALAALCASVPVAAPAADPYEINVVLSTTGSIAFLGKSIADALALVEENVNKTGGIQGRQVKFTVLDDASAPANAVQLANKIVAAKPAVMLGTSLNATCSAMAPLLKDGPVDMCFSPGIHPEEGSFVFSPAPSTNDLAIATSHYVKRRGWKRIAFIFSTDSSGIDGEKVITCAFAAPEMKDVTITTIEHFAVNDLSVAAQIARVKSSGAEALYVWASGTPSQTVMRGIQDAGLDVPIMTSYSNATARQMAAYKGYLPKELLTPGLPSMVPPDQLAPGQLRDAVTQYYNAFKAVGQRPDVIQTTAWDAAYLIVGALRKLGPNATAAQVREYIANLRGWTGVTGTFDFKAIPQRGINWKSSVLMARWDPARDGWVAAGPLGG